MERFKSYSRLTGYYQFRCIAEKNLDRFEILNPKFLRLKKEISYLLSSCDDPENPPPEYYDLHIEMDPIGEERDQCRIVAVVFTAMYFEAFIYDYAASCLGDNYSKEHVLSELLMIDPDHPAVLLANASHNNGAN